MLSPTPHSRISTGAPDAELFDSESPLRGNLPFDSQGVDRWHLRNDSIRCGDLAYSCRVSAACAGKNLRRREALIVKSHAP